MKTWVSHWLPRKLLSSSGYKTSKVKAWHSEIGTLGTQPHRVPIRPGFSSVHRTIPAGLKYRPYQIIALLIMYTRRGLGRDGRWGSGQVVSSPAYTFHPSLHLGGPEKLLLVVLACSPTWFTRWLTLGMTSEMPCDQAILEGFTAINTEFYRVIKTLFIIIAFIYYYCEL